MLWIIVKAVVFGIGDEETWDRLVESPVPADHEIQTYSVSNTDYSDFTFENENNEKQISIHVANGNGGLKFVIDSWYIVLLIIANFNYSYFTFSNFNFSNLRFDGLLSRRIFVNQSKKNTSRYLVVHKVYKMYFPTAY